MPRLRFSEPANRNLISILDYLTQQSGNVDVGLGFTERIQQRCEDLAALPITMGRDRSELQPGLRSIAFRNYVIFFRYVGDVFEVVNVLEGHRDFDANFHDNEGEP